MRVPPASHAMWEDDDGSEQPKLWDGLEIREARPRLPSGRGRAASASQDSLCPSACHRLNQAGVHT